MKKLIAATLLTGALIGGCSSYGSTALKDETAETLNEKIELGMSKAQIREMFGEPNEMTADASGRSTWEYVFGKGQSNLANYLPYGGLVGGGSSSKDKRLYVEFDSSNTVVDYRMGSGQMDRNTSVIQ